MKKNLQKKLFSCIAAATLALSFTLAPYMAVSAPPQEEDAPEEAQATTIAAQEYDYTRFMGQGITLNVYNWGLYISDGTDDTLNVIKEFEELTGITINYTTFASNEEMYTKIKMGGADYDVVIPSDYMIGRMINEGLLATLNYENIPNAGFIGDAHKSWAYDPENLYSIPYLWGTVGLIYNTTMVEGPVDSWDILWDENYTGNVLMFNNSRDAFAIAFARLGMSFNPASAEDIAAAAQLLKEQKVVAPSYVMDEIFDKLEGGEAAVGPYYAGDAVVMLEENPDLAFVYPKEGTNYFVDAMCILASSQQKEAAEMFINFMCETDIALANAEATGYSTPHTGAYELLPEEVRQNPITYPGEEVMANTQVFTVLSEEVSAAMDAAWSDIRSYDEAGNKWLMPVVLVGMAGAVVLIMVNRARNKKKRDEY